MDAQVMLRKATEKPVIAIIDDEPEIRHLLRMALEGMKIDIKLAPSAAEGMEIFEDYRVDLAIVDIFMPGHGGVWAIKEIQKRFPNVAIITITGGHWDLPPRKVKLATEKMGVAHSLTKPFSLNEVRDVTERLLRQMGRLAS